MHSAGFLSFIGFLSSTYALYPDNIPCQPNLCGCSFPDGYGIDLKFLKSANLTFNDSEVQFNLKLCSNVKINESLANCSSTSFYMLRYNGTNVTSCDSLGSAEDMVFVWGRKIDTPYLKYTSNSNITNTIILDCDQNSWLNQLSRVSSNPHEFRLSSKWACPHYLDSGGGGGPSVIVILLIIVLVLFLVYMILGMLVLKFIRGAEGVEIIPNHEFWLSIPTHLKNCLLFCMSGCKSPATYDRI